MDHLNFRKPGVRSPSARERQERPKDRDRWQGASGGGNREKGCPVPWGHGGKVEGRQTVQVQNEHCLEQRGQQSNIAGNAGSLVVQRGRAEDRTQTSKGKRLPISDADADCVEKRAEETIRPSNLDFCYQSDVPWHQHCLESLHHFQT